MGIEGTRVAVLGLCIWPALLRFAYFITNMKPIVANTCTKAWLSATQHLQSREDWRDYTVVLEIAEPMQLPTEDKKVYEIVDSFLAGRASIRLSTVINTIFPATLFKRYGGDNLLEEYRRLLPQLSRHNRFQKWGTYADRLTACTNAAGKTFNPLGELIEKLRGQLANTSHMRAAYEVNTLDFVTDIPIYRAETDRHRPIGGPCLSHLSFKLTADRRLMLTALYRSHYYIYRALGNLYGLAWLQFFVASQLQIQTAELVCHSSMAKLDTLRAKPEIGVKGWGTADVKRLLVQCDVAINGKAATR